MDILADSIQKRKDLLNRYRMIKEQNDASLLGMQQPNEQDLEGVRQAQADAQSQAQDFALAKGLMSAANQAGSLGGQVAKTDLSALDEINKAAVNKANLDALNIDKRQNMFQDIQKQGMRAAEQEVGLSDAMAQEQIQKQQMLQQEKEMNAPLDVNMLNSMNQSLQKAGYNIQLPATLTRKQLESSPILKKLSEVAVTSPGELRKEEIRNNADLRKEQLKLTADEKKYKWEAEKLDKQLANQQARDAAKEQQTANKLANSPALKKLEIDARNAVSKKAMAEKKLSDLTALYKQANTGGLVGNITGSYIGNTKANTKLDAFLNRDAAAVIKDISGATVGKEEAEKLARFIPSRTDSQDAWDAKVAGLLAKLQEDIDTSQYELQNAQLTYGVEPNTDIRPINQNAPVQSANTSTPMQLKSARDLK